MAIQIISTVIEEKSANAPNAAATEAYSLCNWVDTGAKGNPPASWSVLWQPADPTVPGYAVILKGATANSYAVVIQGTKDKQDWTWDMDCQTQVAFPFVANANISQGAANALAGALSNTDDTGTTFASALKGISQPANSFLLTGHSLGGFLTSILAAWLSSQLTGNNTITALASQISPITFAPPAMADSNLASFLNSQANYTAYFNTNDAIPYVWAMSGNFSVPNLYNLFPAPGPSPMPQNFETQVAKNVTAMQNNNVSYQQTNGITFTVATVKPPIGNIIADQKWMWELTYEHNTAYYNYFLGGQ